VDVWQIVERLARGIWRRHKRLLVFTLAGALAALLPLAWYLSKEPPRYRTSATVLLETRPDKIPLFQEFSPFRPLPVQLAILKSRSLAEGVLDSLPASSFQDLVENPYYVDYELKVRNWYRRLRGKEPEVESPQRRALKELQNARVTFDSRGDGIVTIAAEAARSQVAVDIVNTFIEVLISRTRTFNIDDARVSREFLEGQVAEVRKSLAASEGAARAFTLQHGGIKIPEQSQAAIAQLSQTEQALAEARSNRKMVETRLANLRQKLEVQKRTAPPPVPAAAPVPPPAPPSADVQRLRALLSQLETALLEMRTKYTEEHPRIVLVKDRIEEVTRQLGDAVKEVTPLTPAPDAVPPAERVPFQEQILALETSLQVLSAQEDALRGQAQTLRQSLNGLSASELEYSRLTRELESNRNLHAMLADKLTGARIKEQGEMKVVKVIDPAGFPQAVASEKRLRFMGVALFLAVVLGAGGPAAVEWIHKTVEGADDVERATGLPVLAVIPRLRSSRPMFASAISAANGLGGEVAMFTEALRSLRVAVQLATRADGLRTFMVASPFPSEGKSTLVVNLGLAFREAGKRVVLADTDFLRPTLHRTMKIEPAGGLVEALHSSRRVEDSLAAVGEGMWLASHGKPVPPQALGVLTSNGLPKLIEDLAERADLVICDSSPVLLVPDNLFLAAAVDAVILVAKTGSTRCEDLARAKGLLEGVGARLLGVVLNEVPVSMLRPYRKRYYTTYVRRDVK
jgi:capsular exopolysaccharide synthesis family protein